YVIDSPVWNGQRGAVTWGNGKMGVSGTISDANSLIGSNRGDELGSLQPYSGLASDITVLSNGNYVIGSPGWNGKRGAVTWGNANTGVSGIISEANSLLGSRPSDEIGQSYFDTPGIVLLSNGNYVVDSPRWNAGRGAATWGNGSTGVRGAVSDANSL